jgi:hypothetical protein
MAKARKASKRHMMTAARKAALHKAQTASAAQRKGKPTRGKRPTTVTPPGRTHRVTPRTRATVQRAAIGATALGAGAALTYAGLTSPAVHRGVQSARAAQFNRRNTRAVAAAHVNRARADYAHTEALRAHMRLQPGAPFNVHAARREARSTLAHGRRLARATTGRRIRR